MRNNKLIILEDNLRLFSFISIISATVACRGIQNST